MDLQTKDITTESWREYDFGGRVYRIEAPVTLMFRPDGSTHRVIDRNNVVHCVPAPGHCGCVLRWVSRDGQADVSF